MSTVENLVRDKRVHELRSLNKLMDIMSYLDKHRDKMYIIIDNHFVNDSLLQELRRILVNELKTSSYRFLRVNDPFQALSELEPRNSVVLIVTGEGRRISFDDERVLKDACEKNICSIIFRIEN